MSNAYTDPCDPRMTSALEALERLIRRRYPEAQFAVLRDADEPTVTHLAATVAYDDPDDVLDVVMDRLLALQVEERLPIHVLPLLPVERPVLPEASSLTTQGQESYPRWVEKLQADPAFQKLHREEAAKSELWLQLGEARQQAGRPQQQVAERMGVSQAQKASYDAYTLRTLRRDVETLGDAFTLQVRVTRAHEADESCAAATD